MLVWDKSLALSGWEKHIKKQTCLKALGMSISQESSLVLLTFKSRGLIGNYQPELSSRHFHVTQCLTVTENCALSLQHVVQNIKPHKKIYTPKWQAEDQQKFIANYGQYWRENGQVFLAVWLVKLLTIRLTIRGCLQLNVTSILSNKMSAKQKKKLDRSYYRDL